MNIIFTCGGTAGHVNPAVGLAHLFTKYQPDCNILFVGAKRGMETKLVPKEGFDIRTVDITNLRRSAAPKDVVHNIKTVGNVYRSRGQARKIIDDFSPDLVVGTGGYASYPLVALAAKKGIPTAVHESNAVPGITTKSLAKLVDCVMVGFEESVRYYPSAKRVEVTGTPVRRDFFKYTREEARELLGMNDNRPLLLSYWGSLGASKMNKLMVETMAKECYEGAPFRHIHGAGRDYRSMRGVLAQKDIKLGQNGIELREYIYDMPLVMAAADLVLCRAGASTIAELTALQKPAILVPSPNVTANHQEKNARLLSDQGAAILLKEDFCTSANLYQTTETLLRQLQKQEEMREALGLLQQKNSAETIYQTLLSLMG
ncbi:MAG: undecaprenyldiphospho-muramoylpentapeptide beta-N-acetylglucosaminyltransferase [Eubacteriales bacterium]